MGYLLEELRDASNFKALQADVASANIFIGSLIFIEELADKVGRCTYSSCCHTAVRTAWPKLALSVSIISMHHSVHGTDAELHPSCTAGSVIPHSARRVCR